jgi:hypothetical protein
MKSQGLFLSVLLSLLVGLFSLVAHAESSNHPLMTSEEQEIQARARKKLYPGGRDEEPLKVQEQLAQPVRKIGPATEAPQEDPSND